MSPSRIGLFGGTFDPVHAGHLRVAQAALEEACLDRLFFIPAARSPFKVSEVPSAGRDRLRWIRLALAGRNACEVDDSELRRGGVSYAVDTMRAYRKRYPEVSLLYLIGADHIKTLPEWRDAIELARDVEFLAVPRPGESHVAFPEPFRGSYLSGLPCQVSSSIIRQRVRCGKSISGLVPAFVEEDIVNRNIYL
ncbi:MAG: nicotinate (nicotinamide) nucleotide adenylyltransferase [Verrucomicrobiota bacterium]|jgi:nicotinate-nucleotide adenylyltransferase|nr:nicotinate (nicotinamide) nucleotide adenylyltransferase [Verrucomicrobiota bacterium]